MSAQAIQTIDLIASVIAIVTFVVSAIRIVSKALQSRSTLSRLIFSGGFLSTVVVLTGISIVFLPVFTSVGTRVNVHNVTIGDDVAIVGWALGLVSWLAALSASFRAKQVVLCGGLVTLGFPIYAGALFYSDISAYLLVGALPTLFGLFASERASK